MKTKMFLFLLIMISSMAWSLKSSASHVHVYLNDTWDEEYFYFCAPLDTVIVYKPSTAISNIYWDPPIGPNRVGVDSVIITTTTTGTWFFNSDDIYKYFYVYIGNYLPMEPACMAHDTSFCTPTFSLTLDAQNHLPGGYAATYQWSTGETTRIITVTTPDTYTVTITRACGVGIYDIIITQANPNAPNLGADQTFCLGSSTTLDPGSTNVTNYFWSTGATTPTLTVNSNGNYWVYVLDNNGCSGYDTIAITTIQTSSQDILLATINTDPISPNYGNNMMTWDIDPLLVGNVSTANVYRESGTNNYIQVGSTNYADGAWTDIVNSTGHTWKYKISLVGTPCGEGDLSGSVQTIHCWVSQYMGTYTIQWDPYIIGSKSTVTWYKVLSGNGLNQLTVRDSISGSGATSLTLPNTTDSIFVVGAELSGAKSFSGLALSNKTSNPVVTGIHKEGIIPFSVYPNPATDNITIEIGFNDFQVEVSTMLGQELLSEQNTKVLNVRSLPQGMYIISITADGIRTNQRFIKN